MEQEKENSGIRVLKKGRNGILSAIFSRFGLILLLLAIQVVFLIVIFRWFEAWVPHIYGGSILFTVGLTLYVLNSRSDPTSKLTWLLIILLLPVFGGLLYLYTMLDVGHRALKGRVNQLADEAGSKLVQDPTITKAFQAQDPGAAALARYINSNGCYPAP